MGAEVLCAWCSKPVRPEEQRAERGDGMVWHADPCFVMFLAHKDEIRGINRATRSS